MENRTHASTQPTGPMTQLIAEITSSPTTDFNLTERSVLAPYMPRYPDRPPWSQGGLPYKSPCTFGEKPTFTCFCLLPSLIPHFSFKGCSLLATPALSHRMIVPLCTLRASVAPLPAPPVLELLAPMDEKELQLLILETPKERHHSPEDGPSGTPLPESAWQDAALCLPEVDGEGPFWLQAKHYAPTSVYASDAKRAHAFWRLTLYLSGALRDRLIAFIEHFGTGGLYHAIRYFAFTKEPQQHLCYVYSIIADGLSVPSGYGTRKGNEAALRRIIWNAVTWAMRLANGIEPDLFRSVIGCAPPRSRPLIALPDDPSDEESGDSGGTLSLPQKPRLRKITEAKVEPPPKKRKTTSLRLAMPVTPLPTLTSQLPSQTPPCRRWRPSCHRWCPLRPLPGTKLL